MPDDYERLRKQIEDGVQAAEELKRLLEEQKRERRPKLRLIKGGILAGAIWAGVEWLRDYRRHALALVVAGAATAGGVLVAGQDPGPPTANPPPPTQTVAPPTLRPSASPPSPTQTVVAPTSTRTVPPRTSPRRTPTPTASTPTPTVPPETTRTATPTEAPPLSLPPATVTVKQPVESANKPATKTPCPLVLLDLKLCLD